MYGPYDYAFGFVGGYRRTWTKDDIRILIWCCTNIVQRPEKTPCWVWRLRLSPGGYAYMHINREPLMHRTSYRAFKGPIPDGKVIMHLCNNKSCVNPKHLEVGDTTENIRMAIVDGLHPASFHYQKIYQAEPKVNYQLRVRPKVNFLRRF